MPSSSNQFDGREFLEKISSEHHIVNIVIFSFIVIILFCVGWWIFSKLSLDQRNCAHLNTLYKNKFPPLSSISPTDSVFQFSLRNYFIKTAYNCCCGGAFKNDYVNVCALKNAIKQGARCLDFEIYSVNNRPVVSAASIDSYTVKQLFNSVPLSVAMKVVNDYAFSNSTSPNHHDPVILHFRIMSKRKELYDSITKILADTLGSRLLDENYSYENHGKNLGADNVCTFLDKVIIAVDKTNPTYVDTPLYEFVNIASNSAFLRILRQNQVIYTPDSKELKDFNKKNMTIVLPNLGVNPTNMDSAICMRYGCQMVGMSLQNLDTNMEYNNLFFDKVGHAFAIKPENMRFVPTTIDKPKKLGLNLGYQEREIPNISHYTKDPLYI